MQPAHSPGAMLSVTDIHWQLIQTDSLHPDGRYHPDDASTWSSNPEIDREDYIASHGLNIFTTVLGLVYILLEYRASIGFGW